MPIVILIAAFLLRLSPGTPPEPAQKGLTPEMQAFFETFRDAAKAKDAARLAELAHRESRSCATSEKDGYSSRNVAAHVRIFGKDASVKAISFRPATDEELERVTERDSAFYWSVRPEGAITVQFEAGTRVNAANLMVGRDDGEWRWVHLCHH